MPEQMQMDLGGASLSGIEAQIAGLIIRRTKDNPIPVSAIMAVTNMTDRAVRNVTRDLVMEHGLPIGSSSASNKPGFYWIHDSQELQQAADRHIRFGLKNIVRGHRLVRQNRDRIVGQLEAELENHHGTHTTTHRESG